jgi:predicted glycoside hydrolase/deacetylase ChbG (UPF0249 family)
VPPESGAPAVRLIVNCDDFGSFFSANEGVAMALGGGVATSATLMVPCPWAYDAARRAAAHPEWGVGVHLTHTAEWPRYRWRPLLGRERVPGLCDPDGFLWARVADVYAHATPEEALAEGSAQVEQALAWGLCPTHLDSHMGVLQLHPGFFEVYLALAERFRLPLRMPSEKTVAEVSARLPWAADTRRRARACGIPLPDGFFYGSGPAEPGGPGARAARLVRELPPGTWEMLFHPAVDGPELRGVVPAGGEDRVRDLRALTEDPDLRRALAERRVELVTFRDLAPA